VLCYILSSYGDDRFAWFSFLPHIKDTSSVVSVAIYATTPFLIPNSLCLHPPLPLGDTDFLLLRYTILSTAMKEQPPLSLLNDSCGFVFIRG
jgi:hypothetical protein